MFGIQRDTPLFYGISVGLLIVLGTSFGLNFSISKLALEAASPLNLVFWQAFGAGILLAFALQVRGHLLPIPKRLLWLCPLAAAWSFVLPNIVFNTALDHLPPGLTSMMLAVAPFFAYALALGFRTERLNSLRITGLLLGFCGVLALVLPKSALPSPDMLPWLLVCLFPPFAYASTNYLLERALPSHINPIQFTALMLLCAGLFCLPLILWQGDYYRPSYATRGDMAVYGVILLSAFNFAILFTLNAWRGSVFTSQGGNLVTLTGLMWGYVIFGDRLTPWMLVATALIIGGVVLVNQTHRRHQE